MSVTENDAGDKSRTSDIALEHKSPEEQLKHLIFGSVFMLCIPIPALFALLEVPILSAIAVALGCIIGFVLGMPCLLLDGDNDWDRDWGE